MPEDVLEDYFYVRAEAELELAQRAEHPAAVKAHYELAGYYLDRSYNPQSEVEDIIHAQRSAQERKAIGSS